MSLKCPSCSNLTQTFISFQYNVKAALTPLITECNSNEDSFHNHIWLTKCQLVESTVTHEWHSLNHRQRRASVRVQTPWRSRSRESDVKVTGCKAQLVWYRSSQCPVKPNWLLNLRLESVCLGGRTAWGRSCVPKTFLIVWCWGLFCSCHLFSHSVFIAGDILSDRKGIRA